MSRAELVEDLRAVRRPALAVTAVIAAWLIVLHLASMGWVLLVP